MNSVGIIGFGRFGKVLSSILQKGFSVKAYDGGYVSTIASVKMVDLDEILREEVIFIAVPIRRFEEVITEITPKLGDNQTVIDVCSVKSHPVEVMTRILPGSVGIIATHPLFGPDSFRSSDSLKMMMDATRDVHSLYSFWKEFFTDQGIQIIEMSPDSHDRLAASTQGVTHFLGRALREFGIRKTSLDTQGFNDLLDLVDQTCNDTWELFTDLQHYNPYTREMVEQLKKAYFDIDEKIKDGINDTLAD
ncbi:MAG: prephenate dehydrogenase/arogenate dehydrogenase family protein [Candidatus Neomarinimicrobiota bacterium]|nr:prephenate dehydrogenase/arogenate dehydrogenase family protein [Candidatus Neomarinimicrobiota bacterium]